MITLSNSDLGVFIVQESTNSILDRNVKVRRLLHSFLYVSTRYPDALGGALPYLAFPRAQSVEALRLAKMVLDAASNVVPHSSRESSPLG